MKKAGILILLAAQLVIILAFWAWNHVNHTMGNQLAGEAVGQLLAYGRLAGLLAVLAILLQLILMGRVKWVESVFGLDRLSRLHHILGFSLVVLLVLHPVLVTIGHAKQSDTGIIAQFIDFCRDWEDVLAAAVGLGLMIFAIIVSIAIIRKHLRYETWHIIHMTFYISIALAFGHQLAVGSDFTGNRYFAGYWYFLYIFTFGNLIYYRIIRPLWKFKKHRFVVSGIVPESADVTSVHIEGREMASFRINAGQFMMLRFMTKGFRWQSHPFSMSCIPDGRHIRVTIKQLGDFTRRIPDIKPGTPVIIDGPHGVFTARQCHSLSAVMIAGGIGITPIRSLSEELLNAGRNVHIIYSNRNQASIVFRKELDELAAAFAGRLKLTHVISEEPSWDGEHGRLDRDKIARLVPDTSDCDFYLCGPPPMMMSMRLILLKLGVRSGKIHYERFSL